MSDLGSWKRFAPVPRNSSFGSGLRGRVHDPLWLVSRQWQLRELRGADAGRPVDVDLSVVHDEIETVRLRGDGVDADDGIEIPYEGGPLEPVIEREYVATGSRGPGARVRAETGRQFRRLIADAAGDGEPDPLDASAFPAALRLERPHQPMEAADRRYFQVMADRAVDGYRVYRELLDATTNLAAVLADDEADRDERVSLSSDGPFAEIDAPLTTVRAAAADYLRWYRRLYDEPVRGESIDELADDVVADEEGVDSGGEEPDESSESSNALVESLEEAGSAWRPTRFEYDAAIETEAGVTFELTGYAGGRLDRDHFVATDDLDVPPADPAAGEPVEKRLLPRQLEFPGMPSTRWWTFTDSSIAIDDLSGHGAPLPYLLVLESAVEFGNDWFVVPVRAPLGSLSRIADCRITDSFGVELDAEPVQDDDWRLYGVDELDGSGLFVPPTLRRSETSDPVETVRFGRDEMANLVFGLEELVEGPTGRPVDRTEFRLPEVTVDTVRAADDPDDEYVTLANRGDDALEAGTVAVRAVFVDDDGESESTETVFEFDEEGPFRLGPDDSVRLYSGAPEDADEDGVYGADRETPIWQTADALDVVDVDGEWDPGSQYTGAWADRDEPAIDVEDDAADIHDDGRLLARTLLSRPDACGGYRLVTSVPEYWYPFEMEPWDPDDESVVDDDDVGDGTGFDAHDSYVLTQSLLLDADALDAPTAEIPRPLGRLLDPDSPDLPDDDELPYWMYEEEVTRTGREVGRRYQLARWADGSVHLWSERHSSIGTGELASGLRFDLLDEAE